MGVTRWKKLLRQFAGDAHRELKITLTRPVLPDKWAFIVGSYNSGTELLLKLLGTHPDVSSLPVEGVFLTEEIQEGYEIGLSRMWVLREDFFRMDETSTGPDIERLKREWQIRLDRRKPVFVEKTPSNAARTRWLQKHFHNAHFIALVRNGYAVAEGIRRKGEPRHLPDGWPIDLCARQWARSYEILLEDAEHLDNVLWVKYEDLAEDTERELERIADFLQLKRGVDAFAWDREWKVHEREAPIRNMNAGSMGRLSASDIATINEEAGEMLRYFGYEVIGN